MVAVVEAGGLGFAVKCVFLEGSLMIVVIGLCGNLMSLFFLCHFVDSKVCKQILFII